MKKIYIKKTAKILLSALFLFVAGMSYAQMGIGTANPASSAQLDVSSTNKGFLPPRMTQAQRNAIVNPAAGLMIWCSDCGVLGEIQVFNGFSWSNMVGGTPSTTIPKRVTIGTQEWMTRNLDVVTFRNGDSIPQVSGAVAWASATGPAWCYYNNDPANGAVYGKLYNWYAVNDSRGIAPAGWRLPSDIESDGDWNTLISYVGADAGKLKAPVLWSGVNTVASNETGFTALPGGIRNSDGTFTGVGTAAQWWGSTYGWMYNFTHVVTVRMNGGVATDILESPPVQDDNGNWIGGPIGPIGTIGFSVRCVREAIPFITIGTQEWMQKNLDVSTFRNGDIIPEITDSAEWANTTGPGWCYYNNDPAIGSVYGKLYNWYAVNDARGIAPTGWKVPGDADIVTLSSYLGGMTVAGGKMKEAGTTHWNSPNAGATNSSGFTALPGGGRWVTFGTIGTRGSWWTSTKHGDYGGSYGLLYEQGTLGTGANNFRSGFSVRCIRE